MAIKEEVLERMDAAAQQLARPPYAHLVSAVVMGMELIKAQPDIPPNGDWLEDFEHENGMYTCRCIMCGTHFTGHKRRVICKICH